MSAGKLVTRSDRTGNPPGRTALKLRVGTYPVFFGTMLQQMRQPMLKLPDGTKFENALAALNQDDETAFTPALLSAWASVCDILSFYQERIANEGYLATATDSLSLRELARSIGYRPVPALSAKTFLAFTMIDAQGGPTNLKVPKGSAVQSVPQQDETQVTFETDEEIDARPEWNSFAAKLRAVSVAAQIVGGARQLIVAGILTGVRPGMPVLLHGRSLPLPPGAASEDALYVRALTSVEPNQTERTTLLGWNEVLKGTLSHVLMEAPEAVLFRQNAKLFGVTAPDWSRQPEAVKAKFATRIGDISVAELPGTDWTAIGAGLPPGDVRALAVADDGSIVAILDKAVVTHRGGDWIDATDLPGRSEPTALSLGPNRLIYAGTQRGELFSSSDGGATWFKLAGPTAAGATAARLQAVPVQTLFVQAGSADTKIVAGTSLGIWTAAPNGSDWTPWNAGLPGYDAKNGGATAAINAVACDSSRDRWVAATDQGLFYANTFGGYWFAAGLHSERGSLVWPFAQILQWILARLHAPPKPELANATAPAAATAPPVAEAAPAPSPSGAPTDTALAGPAHALTVLTSESGGVTLFAGTKQGVFCSSNGGRTWRPAASQPGGASGVVKQLAVGKSGLLAGTDKGLFQSADDGATWTPASGPFAGQPVAALAAGSGRQVAAAPFGGYPGSEWPNFEIAGRRIDLDRTYESLIPGGWIILAQPNPAAGAPADFAAARVVTASTCFRNDYLMNDRVTRVALDRDLPHPFNPRTATVYLGGRVLDAANPIRHRVEILGSSDGAANVGSNTGLTAPLRQNTGFVVAGPVHDLKGRTISVSGQRAGARLNGSVGGVRRWDGKTWTRLGTFDSDARALLVGRNGTILLAARNGVQRFEGEDWSPLGNLPEDVNVLAETGDGEWLAGTERGLFRWRDPAWELLGSAQRRVRALLTEAGGSIIAGTSRGLETSADDGFNWIEAVGAVSGQAVTALARARSGLLIAGTRRGLLVATAEDWSHAAHVLGGQDVSALALNSNGQICAATAEGVFWSDDGLTWPTGPDRARGDIRAVVFDPRNDDLYIAQSGVGVIAPNGALWSGLANDIRALAFDRDGRLLAGSMSSTVLLAADDTQTTVIEPKFVADVSGDDLPSELNAGRLSGDLRHIFTQKEIAFSEKAEVRVVVPKLKWEISDGATHYVVHALGSDSVKVFVESNLEVLAWPRRVPGRPELELWRVGNKDGVVADLPAVKSLSGRGEIVFTGAAATNQTVGEIHKVDYAFVAADRSRTTLVLAEPLENVYDAATVTFNANVAPASHGETPALFEVIGSGDSSVPNQTFTLQRKPITVRPSGSAFFDYGIVVRVRGSFESEPLTINEQLIPGVKEEDAIEWFRVETLTSSGPDDRHYVLEEEDDGSITLVFGDGKHGRRLPTGTENVIALYRTGSGPEGNVPAGRLTLLRKRPAGIRKVINPVPASGGAIGEIAASVQLAVPITVRTLGRIVSLRDYQDFVRAWPGTAKVAVRLFNLPQQSRRLVHLTIADAGDATQFTPDSQDAPPDGYSDLRQAIEDHRATDCAVSLERYVPRWFCLEADITADPEGADAVNAAVTSMLLDRYGFVLRNFSEAVTAADVTTAIQDVPGVRAVHLKSLHLLGSKSTLLDVLPSREAYWDDKVQKVHPAELLLIGGKTHISLGGIGP